MERGEFGLRNLAHLAIHLRRRRLVEADRVLPLAADETNRLEHPQDAETGDVGGELGLRERHRYERDRAEVVDLVGLHGAQCCDEAREVGEVAVDDSHVRELGEKRLDLRVVLALDEPVHLVALFVEELREVLAVLAGDARDERASHHCKATRTLNQVPSSDVVVVAGGVGAARFLRALRLYDSDARVTAIVNTGDDTVVNGLHVSPDIDTVTYTLADAIDPVRGWGLRDETWTAMESLRRYTARDAASVNGGGVASSVNDWFNLGDRDLATHLYRTARLAAGAALNEVTVEIARAWGVRARIVPMSNDRVATRVTLDHDAAASDGFAYRAGDTVSFQEYFVRLRHAVAVRSVEFDGAASAAALGLDELRSASTVVIAPSNPIVSIGPVRALRGVDDALAARRDSVVGISPIIGGAALKGPADRMLRELGHEATALGVARMYAPVCGAFVVDTADAALRDQIEALGMRCIVTDTIMKDDHVGRALAATVLEAATSGVRR